VHAARTLEAVRWKANCRHGAVRFATFDTESRPAEIHPPRSSRGTFQRAGSGRKRNDCFGAGLPEKRTA